MRDKLFHPSLNVCRGLDLCCVLLILAAGCMCFSVILLEMIASRPAGYHEGSRSSVEWMAVGSVIVFALAAIPLWVFALIFYFKTLENRNIVMNTLYFVILFGFSWLAGVVIYLMKRRRLVESAMVREVAI